MTRNKSNASFEALQYRQDPLPREKNTSIYTIELIKHYTGFLENHNNTCAENRKIRSLKFDTLYWRHLAAKRKK